MHIIADIGGTKMRIAGTTDLSKFATPVVRETPQSYDEALKDFIDTARTIAGGDTVSGVVIGLPAVLSHDKRSIGRAENLRQWDGHDFARDLEAALKTKVHLENDTALVGLGEATFGAGRGRSIVVYITISTGVNGVRIIDGTIDRAALGFEIGGQYLSHDISHEDSIMTLEGLVSGSAIHARYGVHPRDLGQDWDGWEDLARIAAIGIHNTILHWSPEIVVLGGSMMNEIGIPVASIKRHVGDIMKKFPQIPDIVHSTLQDEGGLYGGLARLK